MYAGGSHGLENTSDEAKCVPTVVQCKGISMWSS